MARGNVKSTKDLIAIKEAEIEHLQKKIAIKKSELTELIQKENEKEMRELLDFIKFNNLNINKVKEILISKNVINQTNE